MGRRKTKEPLRLEEYYCEIESWSRSFCWGVNRMRWEFAPDWAYERNRIVVEGRIWHIDSDIRKRRKYERLSAYLFSSSSPISEWNQEANSIGGVWVEDGALCCGAHMPLDTFVTMVPSLVVGCFKQVVVTVLDLKYNKGRTDETCLIRS